MDAVDLRGIKVGIFDLSIEAKEPIILPAYNYPLDENCLLAAARYIELNPVRARLAERPEDYP